MAQGGFRRTSADLRLPRPLPIELMAETERRKQEKKAAKTNATHGVTATATAVSTARTTHMTRRRACRIWLGGTQSDIFHQVSSLVPLVLML
jgi:hypothetical protein